MLSNQELCDKFLSTIKAKPNNTPKLFSISFLGTTGSGKTTTSQKLAEKLDLYIARNDEIRRFLNSEGIPGKFPDQELVNFIGKSVSAYLYKNKSSHIIDADMIRFHEMAKKNAAVYDAELLLIYLKCPYEVIIKRLQERERNIKQNAADNHLNVGFSLSLEKELHERNEMYEKFPMPKDIFFTINTSDNFEKQIDEIIDKLKINNYINI